MATRLTAQEIEKFFRAVYLPFRRVIPDETVSLLRQALSDLIDEELSGTSASVRPPEFAFGHDRNHDVGSARPVRAHPQFVNMWKVAPGYRALV